MRLISIAHIRTIRLRTRTNPRRSSLPRSHLWSQSCPVNIHRSNRERVRTENGRRPRRCCPYPFHQRWSSWDRGAVHRSRLRTSLVLRLEPNHFCTECWWLRQVHRCGTGWVGRAVSKQEQMTEVIGQILKESFRLVRLKETTLH